jgi:hypothetical protein
MKLHYCIIDDSYDHEARFAQTRTALRRRLLFSYIDGQLSSLNSEAADEIMRLRDEGKYEEAIEVYRQFDDSLVYGTDEIEFAHSPTRVRDGFGPGLEIEYNFTEDGLVIDVHKPVDGEIVWSMSFAHAELVGLISDQFQDLEFPEA